MSDDFKPADLPNLPDAIGRLDSQLFSIQKLLAEKQERITALERENTRLKEQNTKLVQLAGNFEPGSEEDADARFEEGLRRHLEREEAFHKLVQAAGALTDDTGELTNFVTVDATRFGLLAEALKPFPPEEPQVSALCPRCPYMMLVGEDGTGVCTKCGYCGPATWPAPQEGKG